MSSYSPQRSTFALRVSFRLTIKAEVLFEMCKHIAVTAGEPAHRKLSALQLLRLYKFANIDMEPLSSPSESHKSESKASSDRLDPGRRFSFSNVYGSVRIR